MYMFGIIQLPELNIRIIWPDIQYPMDVTLLISESDVRIKYPNSYSISEKNI
jgi:hypothetical protein